MSDIETVLAAIDAARSEADRRALLAGCTPAVLEKLHAVFVYRQMHNEVDVIRAQHNAFTAEMDAAPDEAARLRAVDGAMADPARGREFLAEWAWCRRATPDDHADRYRRMLLGGT